MNKDSNNLSSISSRNARYAILRQIENNLIKNTSIKNINENLLGSIFNRVLIGSRNVQGGVKGIPAPYTVRNLRAGGINIPQAPKFFRPNESSIMGLGRQVRRLITGPKTTEQLSIKYGEIPEPGSQPNIGRMVAKVATKGLLRLASSGINIPTAKGNVNTDVVRRISPLQIASSAGNLKKGINTLLGPQKSPETVASPTPTTPTIPPAKDTAMGSKSITISTRDRAAELNTIKKELSSAEQDVFRRGERQIDLMRPENRIEFVRRYQAAQRKVQDILSRKKKLEAEGSGTYGLAP